MVFLSIFLLTKSVFKTTTQAYIDHQDGEKMLITLFARKEPTSDTVSKALGMARRMDTVLYRDAACTDVAGRYSWFYSGCPDRRFKTVMLNCWKWKLEWLPALKTA
jgi:hypothetical protein